MFKGDLGNRIAHVKRIIGQFDSVLLGFSGGVDSTLLLALCREILAEQVMAITVKHQAVDDEEMAESTKLARMLGAKHQVLDLSSTFGPIFRSNPSNRCYLCKRLIYQALLKQAQDHGWAAVLDASQADDLETDRPGLRALAELGIITPFKTAGLGKRDIRHISKLMDLPTYNKPAQPCWATRFPPGESIYPEKLHMVKKAESYLSELGLQNQRVRFCNGTACIEATPDSVAELFHAGVLAGLCGAFETVGFTGVYLDLPACLKRAPGP